MERAVVVVTRQVWLGLAAAVAIVAAAHDSWSGVLPAAPAKPGPLQPAEDARHARGREVYNFRCYFCHGYSGDARTLAATYLSPQPRNFAAATPAQLPLARIEHAVRHGRPGGAMKSFVGILGDDDIAAVSAFVAREFVRDKAPNTAYHTPANGWPDHQRHAAAFPFARGEIALDAPVESLSEPQRQGRRLFMTTCVACHDRARVNDEGPAWSARPVSFPRMGFVPGQPNTPPVDAVSSASVYAKHEVVPRIVGLSARERRGQALFQNNCAFCHGGDGTGKNWIGQFMEPKARDLTQYSAQTMPAPLLRKRIREGLPGTSMPAWKSVLAPAEIEALGAYVQRAFFRPPAAVVAGPG